MPIYDSSKSRVIRMPKLTEKTEVVDVWFEQGMILLEDPSNPDQIVRKTVEDFELLIHTLAEMVDHLHEMRRKYCADDTAIVDCDKTTWERFRGEARELVREARSQIHVGLPIDVISHEVQSRLPVSARSGFEGKSKKKPKLWVPGDP